MQLSVSSHVPGPCPSTGTGALGEDTTLTRPPRNAPVEILPYVRYQLALHHLHPHRFPGRLSGVFGCKEVVVRNGALLHIPVGLVLQELLGHAHRAVALPAGVREENGWCGPLQDHSPAAGLGLAGDRERRKCPWEIEEVTGGLREKPLITHTAIASNCQVMSQGRGGTQAAIRKHCSHLLFRGHTGTRVELHHADPSHPCVICQRSFIPFIPRDMGEWVDRRTQGWVRTHRYGGQWLAQCIDGQVRAGGNRVLKTLSVLNSVDIS